MNHLSPQIGSASEIIYPQPPPLKDDWQGGLGWLLYPVGVLLLIIIMLLLLLPVTLIEATRYLSRSLLPAAANYWERRSDYHPDKFGEK